MKLLKYTGIALASLFLILLIVSIFLPSEKTIERSIHINAKPARIFPLINEFKQWNKWSPWHQKDTNTQYTYNNVESGKGATLTYKSAHSEVGHGVLTIHNSSLDSLVELTLEMDNAGKATRTFLLQETDSGTNLTWRFYKTTKDMPIYVVPFTKLILPFIENFVGPDYESGLANLKRYMEANPVISIGDFDAEIRDFSGLNYVGIRSKIKGENISATLEIFYANLLEELKKKNIKTSGNPFTINYFARGDTFDIMAAIPCDEPNSYNPPIVSGNLPANKWLVIKYLGAYNQIGTLYSKGFEYLAHQNYKPVGAPMEFYFTDPKTELDSNKWYTELVFPFME
ncbi:MAG: SRPBCC family protein [bacterium]|nr:SRPBCC family protein [bacterium]